MFCCGHPHDTNRGNQATHRAGKSLAHLIQLSFQVFSSVQSLLQAAMSASQALPLVLPLLPLHLLDTTQHLTAALAKSKLTGHQTIADPGASPETLSTRDAHHLEAQLQGDGKTQYPGNPSCLKSRSARPLNNLSSASATMLTQSRLHSTKQILAFDYTRLCASQVNLNPQLDTFSMLKMPVRHEGKISSTA